jgi:hypothetical protein
MRNVSELEYGKEGLAQPKECNVKIDKKLACKA